MPRISAPVPAGRSRHCKILICAGLSVLLGLARAQEPTPAIDPALEEQAASGRQSQQSQQHVDQLDDEKAALDVMMTAYNNSLVTDPQRLLALVGLNVAHDTPFTAGSILENEMIAGVVPEDLENLNILLQIWLNAREYAHAIATLEKIFAIENDGSWLLRAERTKQVSTTRSAH
jgi:hypothetical protein